MARIEKFNGNADVLPCDEAFVIEEPRGISTSYMEGVNPNAFKSARGAKLERFKSALNSGKCPCCGAHARHWAENK